MTTRYILLMMLSLLPWYAGAAPLNKFGSMPQQSMPVPIQQQALLPQQEQQRPAIRAYQQARPRPATKKKTHTSVMFKIKKLLAQLPIKKVQLWQKDFEKKRDHAIRRGKKSMVDYYQRLINLCKKSLAQRDTQE